MENKNQMNKPVSVARYEFIEDLTALINGSNLPAFVVEPILKEMWLESKNATAKQYEIEKEMYEKSLINEK